MKEVSWRACRLGELLNVKHGFAFEGRYFGSMGTHIVLTPGNFHEQGGFKAKGDNEKWYSGPIPEEYVLKEGDVIIAMTEQAEGLLGSSAIVPRSGIYLHNQRLGLIQAQEGVADPQFLYHLFNVQTVRQQIRASASGVKIRHTAPSRIAEVTVAVPPLRLQHRIASMLSVYDDLISNNLRRIQILEQTARAVYREWFIQFRPPGLVAARTVASASSLLPEGWRWMPLPLAANVTYGFPFASVRFNTTADGTPIVRIRDIPSGRTETWTDESAEKKYEISDGDILIGMDGEFHMCVWASGHAYQNQRVAKLRSKDRISDYHLFLALEEPIRTLNQSIVGTTVAHLGASHLDKIQIACPPGPLLARAREFFEPLSTFVQALKQQNWKLSQTRDLLLPRLMSGQIKLDEAAA